MMKNSIIILFVIVWSTVTIKAQISSTSVKAMPDTFTVLQATVDTFAVINNDSIPLGDSVCITLFDTASRFSVRNCNSIIYRPDSTFTGQDTCLYVLCDTAMVCDTSMVVVGVYSLGQLLPVPSFVQDTLHRYSGEGRLFNCNTYNDDRVQYQLFNTSQRTDSIVWRLKGADVANQLYDSVKYFYMDTITFIPQFLWQGPCLVNTPYGICDPGHLEVCLTAYNRYGSVTLCDTSCELVWEGITEVLLSNIYLYPNPADRIFSIDMRQNTNPISTDYAAIGIYDALGQKLRSIPRHDNSRLIEVDVTDFPEGIYISTIVDVGGKEMVLGRFTVLR